MHLFIIVYMDWNVRYSVTKSSLGDVQRHLPDGWQISSFGQPSKEHWFPLTEFVTRAMPTPDVIGLVNPQTGNRMRVIDHSFASRGQAQSLMTSRLYNFGQFGDPLRHLMEHMDRNVTGMTANMTRHSRHRGAYEGAAAFTSLNFAHGNHYFTSPIIFPVAQLQYKSDPWNGLAISDTWNGHHHSQLYPGGPLAHALLISFDHEYGHTQSYGLDRTLDFQKPYLDSLHQSLKTTFANSNVDILATPRYRPLSQGESLPTEHLLKFLNRTNDPVVRQSFADHLLRATANSDYGVEDIQEHYAENFAQFVNPHAPKSIFLQELGSRMNWPTFR